MPKGTKATNLQIIMGFTFWIIAALFVGIYSGNKRKVGPLIGSLICIMTSPVLGYILISYSPYLDESKNKKNSKNGLRFGIIIGVIVLILANIALFVQAKAFFTESPISKETLLSLYYVLIFYCLGIVIFFHNYYNYNKKEEKIKPETENIEND